MPEGPNNNSELLSPSEPTPYRVMNPVAETPVLLVCDHASYRFPAALGDMDGVAKWYEYEDGTWVAHERASP